MGYDDACEERGAGHISARGDVQGPDLVGGCVEYNEEC